MFDKLSSVLHCNWVRSWYKAILRNSIEEIYYNKDRLFVIVKDEYFGIRIYDLISDLADSDKEISIQEMIFKVSDVKKLNRTITSFSVLLPEKFDLEKVKEIKRIYKVVLLVTALNKMGYTLKKGEKIEGKNFDTISEVLALFTTSSQSQDQTLASLIKYCHTELTGKDDFEEFYSSLDEKVFWEISELPYNFTTTKMCYNYYLNGEINRNIYETLIDEDNDYLENCIVVKKNGLDGEFSKSDEYLCVGDIKVFNEMPKEFDFFLETSLHDRRIVSLCDRCNIKKVIDFDGNIIGYKRLYEEPDLEKSMLESLFENYNLNLMFLTDYIRKLNTFILGAKKLMYYEGEATKVNLDKALEYNDDGQFKFKTIEYMFDFFNCYAVDLKSQIVEIFFKILKRYITSQFGNISSEEEMLKIIDIKYLNANLIESFIDYYFSRKVDFSSAYYELDEFLRIGNKMYWLSYIPTATFASKIYFDFEVEKEFGVKIAGKTRKKLKDGRNIIILKEEILPSKLLKKIRENKSEINDYVGEIENDNIRFATYSNLILTRNRKDGEYLCIGYITEPDIGTKVTKQKMLSLNNKELMLVFGYYFSNFSEYYIPISEVWMNENMIFHIELMEDIRIEKNSDKTKISYLKNVINNLIKIGYNPNAFVGLDLSKIRNYSNFFLGLAKNYDKFCDEHMIYYSGEICPVCLKTNCCFPSNFFETAKLLFEDEIAKHYEFDSEYNLKIYNPENVDLAEMEKCIEKIVSQKNDDSFEIVDFKQDCFIPEKNVWDSNKNFVGCLYKKVCFEEVQGNQDVCIDLKNMSALKNLHMLKSLIRLSNQVKMLLDEGLSFTCNPFGHVFLNRAHVKQVQICNVEFLSEDYMYKGKDSRICTIQWICQYAQDILDAWHEEFKDEQFDFLKSIKAEEYYRYDGIFSAFCDFIHNLEEKAYYLTEYCPCHQMYYDNRKIICPKCMTKENQKLMKFEKVSKKKITSQYKKLNEGGEAFIYQYDDQIGHVAKIFKDEINYNLKNAVIAHVMQKSDKLIKINYESHKFRYVIPEKFLVNKSNNKIYGYVMEEVYGSPISILRDKDVVENLGFSRNDILEILIAVGEGIEALHANNIFIGDLNGRNILFDKMKYVYFLDFDGMGVDEISPNFCTDRYIDPVSKKNQMITMADDWYSFAIQAFYYLTYTHPFNGIYNNENGVPLDIPTKMERRISLLGSHGMNPPAIAEPWDWMNKNLISAFYNTFEHDLRESIVPYLVEQYEKMHAEESKFSLLQQPRNNIQKEEIIRINSKLVAKRINPFKDENVVQVIKPNIAIAKEKEDYYAIVVTRKNQKYILSDIPNLRSIEYVPSYIDMSLSKDERYVFVIEKYNRIYVFDLEKDTCIEDENKIVNDNIIVNENAIYYLASSNGTGVIREMTAKDGRVEKANISLVNGLILESFGVENSNNFVAIYQEYFNYDKKFRLYCNNDKICDIPICYHCSPLLYYNILYDASTKTWVVVSINGCLIVINSDGTYKEFKIDYVGLKNKIQNLTFKKGILYAPEDDVLHLIDVKNLCKEKRMECHKFMKSTSKICNITKDGFNVITDGKLYEVRKD